MRVVENIHPPLTGPADFDDVQPPHQGRDVDERLRMERRRRAAQLVEQLKLTASITSKLDSSTTSSAPAPPQSVPAAVAHAVVADLRRRQEANRATLEAEAKVGQHP